MNLAQVRSRLRNGFQPFALVTTAGRRFEVPHPEFIAVGKSVVVVLGSDDLPTKIDPSTSSRSKIGRPKKWT